MLELNEQLAITALFAVLLKRKRQVFIKIPPPEGLTKPCFPQKNRFLTTQCGDKYFRNITFFPSGRFVNIKQLCQHF